ncbi:MAG: phenylalanine--tRNA ligase subunit beta [Oscillospiraceae bacterium]|jgi:phenylalanyl-tRNA synthetase beta chain|nr:phenylalanine--tRNA ligase subunit beta [Oscillospiraceae bacterium]
MKLSREWLHEYVAIPGVGDRDFAEAVTLSGSKVEVTDNLRSKVKNIVVGRVSSIERHADSDHLWVCTVDIGADAPLTIVTGAQNVKAGDIVPVAKHNAVLPDGTKITKGKIRGVKSEGMLCGLEELELDTRDFPYAITDGIFIIDEPDAVVGADVTALLGYDDSVVEFEITNNRPDCLSVRGLAREVAATFNADFKFPEPVVKGSGGDIAEFLKITIENPELCSRYSARVVRNIKVEASPRWLRRRLRASGVRPTNNIVDITNYVMLEYGQPMHAFDYASVNGGTINVRRAKDGEFLTTLDGAKRALNPDMLLITDALGPIGLAGVMGGENSEISSETQSIVLESATFNGVSIRKTATALGMRTDASSRFEKGLDVLNTIPALDRACELIELLGCGEVVNGIADILTPEGKQVRKAITLDPAKVNAFIGADIPTAFIFDTLRKLGFTVEGNSVTAPSWRQDIEHWTDLAEEAARFYGYNNIPEAAIAGDVQSRGLTERQRFERKLNALARAAGYSEALTYSLVPESGGVSVINPLGTDKTFMRTSMLPGMLRVLNTNRDARNKDVKLYELARVYLPQDGETLPLEQKTLVLAALDSGFYSLKNDLVNILTALNVPVPEFIAEGGNATFHPGRCALVGDYGIAGEIHPALSEKTVAAEINVDALFAARLPEAVYKEEARFPELLLDLAFTVDADVTAGAMLAAITSAGGKLLSRAELFDVYTGAQLAKGKKSMAFSLAFRSGEKNLTDEDIVPLTNAILAKCGEACNAQLRQ